MRRLRDCGLLAIALGVVFGTATPASVLAHALAHDRDAHESHGHASSLEAHDGGAELSTPGHSDGHQHARVDQASRTPVQPLVVSPAVAVTAVDLSLTPSELVADVPASSVQAPAPPGDDPPRLRAPPLS